MKLSAPNRLTGPARATDKVPSIPKCGSASVTAMIAEASVDEPRLVIGKMV